MKLMTPGSLFIFNNRAEREWDSKSPKNVVPIHREHGGHSEAMISSANGSRPDHGSVIT